jgi:hypothetical protein
MRQKAYYTANEITTYQYTNGDEWMLTDGTPYVGLYHTYITGEAFTQPEWNKTTSKKLFVLEDTTSSQYIYKKISDIEISNKSIQTITPTITKEDLANKFKTRYIVKKNNDSKFSETTKDIYKSWQKQEIDNTLYTIYPIKWTISGNTQDTYEKGILIPSVQTLNKQSLRTAESIVPGISLYLTDLLELYIDSNIVIATDINGLDS